VWNWLLRPMLLLLLLLLPLPPLPGPPLVLIAS
jgi:hypothetical protein